MRKGITKKVKSRKLKTSKPKTTRKLTKREQLSKNKYPKASIFEIHHGINSQASKNYRAKWGY